MKKILHKLLFFKVCFLLFYSCAIRGGGPTGGEKDVTPPEVIREQPKNFSTNFNATKVVIGFDEFVELNNAVQEISVTPALEKQPEIYLSKRNIVIDFGGAVLQPNTTYTIQFGQAIRDINEGNILSQYKYIFSTGSYIDSLKISGSVLDALSLEPLKDVKIQLYAAENDSAPLKGKPLYFAKASDGGDFDLSYLPKRKFKIFAVQDANQNYTLEPGEGIGFLDSLTTLDSNIVFNRPILVSKYSNRLLEITGAYIGNRKNAYGFTKGLDFLVINRDSVDLRGEKLYNINIERDSVIYYPLNDLKPGDSLTIIARSGADNLDTTFIFKETGIDTNKSFKAIPLISPDNQNKYGYLVLASMNYPIIKYFPPKIYISADTQEIVHPVLVRLDSAATLFAVKHVFEEDYKYTISFGQGAFISRHNLPSDSIAIPVNPPQRKDFGLLEVTVNVDSGSYIFEIVNESGKVFFSSPIYGSKKFTVPYLPPNNYKLRLIKDNNRNGIWDSGSLSQLTQPEEVVYKKEDLNIKANWELVDIVFDARESNNVSREKP